AAADTLEGRGPVDVDQFRQGTDAFAGRSDQRLEHELTSGEDPADFGADADADLVLREIGAVVVVVAVNARLAVGLKVSVRAAAAEPGTPMFDPRDLSVLTVAWRRARANFTLSSVVMRNSLRLALALALARLLVGVFDLQHGFWVIFGTLTVMKSNAGGTRETVLKAVTGTAIGFAIAAVLLTAFEGSHDVWLVLMPMLLFVAMYLSGRTVIAGQAFFTLTIVVLFRVLAPATWTLALLRLEDMAIGAGIGLLIGVFAWPRGAGGQLRASIARLIDTGRRYAELTARQLLSGAEAPHDIARARDDTVAATHRADDVFTQYLTEAGPRRVPVETWGDLLASALRLWYSTDMIRLRTLDARVSSVPVCLELVGLLEEATDRLDAGFAEAAAALRTGTSVTVERPIASDATGPVMSACTSSLHQETDRERLARALQLVEVRAWLRVLSDDLAGLREPVGEVAAKLGKAR
ncbi:MAG: FUSC family protein, partial [Acidimicrobiia bacterium]